MLYIFVIARDFSKIPQPARILLLLQAVIEKPVFTFSPHALGFRIFLL